MSDVNQAVPHAAQTQTSSKRLIESVLAQVQTNSLSHVSQAIQNLANKMIIISNNNQDHNPISKDLASLSETVKDKNERQDANQNLIKAGEVRKSMVSSGEVSANEESEEYLFVDNEPPKLFGMVASNPMADSNRFINQVTATI